MTQFQTAEESDPVRLGWMVGAPPPPDRQISFRDGGHYQFPKTRWSFSNFRQFGPTRNVSKGLRPPSPLARREIAELDAVEFKPMGSDKPMTWGQAFDANYADGVLVLHRGAIVYERYGGVFKPESQHIAMSVTKSFFGLLGQTLVEEKLLDEDARVVHYIPELKGSAFADATIRQVLDMRTGIRYSENYADPGAEIWTYVRAGEVLPRPPNYTGPQNFYEFLQTIQREGSHGGQFAYKTVNTDVIGWVIRRVCGRSISEIMSDRIWSKLGMEQDAYFSVDSAGTEFAGGGLSAGLRDLARFGEMLRNEGACGGEQVIPASVIDDIRFHGDSDAFGAQNFPTLAGWCYRNMWWVSNNANGAYAARGIHGQTIYIDPAAEMVIVRFASHPIAMNHFIDPTSLPAYQAVARFLMH